MRNTVYFLDKQSLLPLDKDLRLLLRRAVNNTLKYEKVDFPAEVSVSFVTPEEIHELNLSYRRKDAPTDVLSFPMQDWNDVDEIEEGEKLMLGDIILCTSKIIEQANAFGHSVEREAAYLTIHSTLHLLGYDHETGPEDEKIMTKKQDEIIKGMGL